jgi:phosphoribosylformylglycinamidine synthase subunit PurQ / glutaminase
MPTTQCAHLVVGIAHPTFGRAVRACYDWGMRPRTLVLRTAGINCDGETVHAFEQAGAGAELVHVNRLLERPALLGEYQMLAIPGGFSYGDDIAAGRILANQMRHHLGEAIARFIESGKPIIGICNGFQVLVKTDLLPGSIGGREGQTCTLAHNEGGRFIDRWVHLSGPASRCIWTEGVGHIELPIAHGEGKFVARDEEVLRSLVENQQIALVYARDEGSPARGEQPWNPNGSVADIAGVCDASGLVFGLMPHPERFVDSIQHPAWTSRPTAKEGEGLRIFRKAVRHVEAGVGAGV